MVKVKYDYIEYQSSMNSCKSYYVETWYFCKHLGNSLPHTFIVFLLSIVLIFVPRPTFLYYISYGFLILYIALI